MALAIFFSKLLFDIRLGIVARHGSKKIFMISPPNEKHKPPRSPLVDLNNIIFWCIRLIKEDTWKKTLHTARLGLEKLL